MLDGKEPFFAVINDMEPHLRYEPPEALAAKFVRGTPTAKEIDEARLFQYPDTTGYCLGVVDVPLATIDLLSDLYDAEIAALDAEIGRLLDGLRTAGRLDDTIVVICADHGENFGEHHRLGHVLDLHRTLLNVPLLVRFPGRFDGGRTVKDVVRLEDVPPTLLELCGLAPIDGADGASLTGGLAGRLARATMGDQSRHVEEAKQHFPRADFTMFHTTIRSVYDGRWHFLAYSDGREELFDVTADPGETRNAAAEHASELARLRGLLPK
jgi:arylsulfatase A-like enzyme